MGDISEKVLREEIESLWESEDFAFEMTFAMFLSQPKNRDLNTKQRSVSTYEAMLGYYAVLNKAGSLLQLYNKHFNNKEFQKREIDTKDTSRAVRDYLEVTFKL